MGKNFIQRKLDKKLEQLTLEILASAYLTYSLEMKTGIISFNQFVTQAHLNILNCREQLKMIVATFDIENDLNKI